MRKTEFRGKNLLGKWRYGDLVQEKWKSSLNTNEKVYMIKKDKRAWTVNKETVGQYTGLKDKNRVKIYEGDIVKDIENNKIGEIKYIDKMTGFFLVSHNGKCISSIIDVEIIGNIYDNPELLKESD